MQNLEITIKVPLNAAAASVTSNVVEAAESAVAAGGDGQTAYELVEVPPALSEAELPEVSSLEPGPPAVGLFDPALSNGERADAEPPDLADLGSLDDVMPDEEPPSIEELEAER